MRTTRKPWKQLGLIFALLLRLHKGDYHKETIRLHELSPLESAPVLKRYITDMAITRPYFDVQFDAPLEAFVAEAPRHPVFLIS